MWFIYSYFITIILSLLLVILGMGIKPTPDAKLKDYSCLFFFFIPIVNWFILILVTLLVLVEVKDHFYKKFIDQIKKSLEVKE